MGNRFLGIPRAWILFIISFATIFFTLGGNWVLNAYLVKKNSEVVLSIKNCQDDLKQEVSTIKTENVYRDKSIESFAEFVKTDKAWKIDDANWKGRDAEWKKMQADINKSNLYYGGLDKVQRLMELSDENKKEVFKKREVE